MLLLKNWNISLLYRNRSSSSSSSSSSSGSGSISQPPTHMAALYQDISVGNNNKNNTSTDGTSHHEDVDDGDHHHLEEQRQQHYLPYAAIEHEHGDKYDDAVYSSDTQSQSR